ncbi:methyltransferase domain-containing protein [Oryzobacter telluris]|jgi:23S rRNA (uracil747-C5)-methyltransferase|uniref:methyltransferase domain-containing protein n=1 Tax=Oryzobacter telluris TaxID=3149179 RepID=UPI00370D50AB
MQCDYFDAGRCRSCTLMGTPYRDQAADKAMRAAASLAEVAPHLRWLEPFTGAEQAFRNKAKLVVAGRAGAPTFGILDAAGRGVDLRRCGLYEPGLAATFDPLHRFVSDLGLEPYDVPGRRGELKHVIVTHSPDGEHLVRFVVRTHESVELLRAALPDLTAALPSARVVTANVLPEHKAVLEGDTEVVLTREALLPLRLPDVTLMLGPRSFLQTNTRVAVALYAQARAWVEDRSPATVWDLYCGVGGFALHLARPGRRVVGVETSAEAVAAATAGAIASGTGSPEVEFAVGDATTHRPDGPGPDLVVVNPPRRGIGPELAAWLEVSSASHLVYSSCHLGSLERDLTALPSWRAVEARPFDMFPQTTHLETAVLLERT